MSPEERKYFDLLKKEIAVVMQSTYPGIKLDPDKWNGQEITDFQEDLRVKVNDQVSEKWFYTHIKGLANSLPRIDVLNLLSRYAGYANWEDFKYRNGEGTTNKAGIRRGNRMFILVPVLVLATLALLYGLFKLSNTRTYTFSFYDATTRQPINGMKIEVHLFNEEESPTVYMCDSNGRAEVRTDRSKIRMVVMSPYFQTDTITRILKKFNTSERFGLHANEYALMINYFSTMNVKDWGKRRAQLDSIIDESAVIYRVYGRKKQTAIELLNKEEFIDFLSLPSASLKGMEILDMRNLNGRIKILRYRINEELR